MDGSSGVLNFINLSFEVLSSFLSLFVLVNVFKHSPDDVEDYDNYHENGDGNNTNFTSILACSITIFNQSFNNSSIRRIKNSVNTIFLNVILELVISV